MDRAPGVYIQDITSGFSAISQRSSTVGVLIGVTKSGVINTPIKIGSWTEFIEKFANGLTTPFMADSYLPYSVYGFFANGGKELYVVSTKKNGVKASKESVTYSVTASTEGTWGNSVKVKIDKSSDWVQTTNESFDVSFSVGTEVISKVSECYLSDIVTKVMSDTKVQGIIGNFTVKEGVEALVAETLVLESGSDGTALSDSDYVQALSLLDTLDDVTFVALPGQTSSVVMMLYYLTVIIIVFSLFLICLLILLLRLQSLTESQLVPLQAVLHILGVKFQTHLQTHSKQFLLAVT